MRSLQSDTGPDLVLDHLRYLRIRLCARAATRDLGAEIGALFDVLSAAQDTYLNALAARVGTTNEIQALDGDLDSTMARLAIRAKGLVDNKLDDPRYAALFSAPPSEAMRPVVDASQTRFVRQVIEGVAKDPLWASLQPLADQLGQDLQAVDAAVQVREPQYVAEGTANAALATACDAARWAHNLMPSKLEILYGTERKRFIDSFFKSTTTRAAQATAAAPAA